jgi:hypothetical protein
LLSIIPGELGIPEPHHMREGAPDAVDFASERVAVTDEGRDVQERTLHVRHLHRKKINIDGRYMQTLLIVDPLLSQYLGQGNDHGTTAHTGFMCPDEFLFLDQMLGSMHEHFGHGLTHRVRREKLAALFVMKFEAVIQHAEHIGALLFEAQGEHAEEEDVSQVLQCYSL